MLLFQYFKYWLQYYASRILLELKLETPSIFLPTPVCLPDDDFFNFSLHLCEIGENNWILTSGNVLLIHICALDIP